MGEDANMQMLKLQDAVQRSQQMLQMMSNISKMMHDTAMSVIRNMK